MKMKNILFLTLLTLLSQSRLTAQGSFEFNIAFAGSSNDVPSGSAILTGNQLSVGIFVGTAFASPTSPTNAWILQVGDGGALTPIFQFSRGRAHGTPPGPFSYFLGGALDLTDSQVEAVLGGNLYARVVLNDSAYVGQIEPVPEPTAQVLITFGAAILFLSRCKLARKRPPNFSLEPTAAGLSVCVRAGRFGAPELRRCPAPGGCGSVSLLDQKPL